MSFQQQYSEYTSTQYSSGGASGANLVSGGNVQVSYGAPSVSYTSTTVSSAPVVTGYTVSGGASSSALQSASNNATVNQIASDLFALGAGAGAGAAAGSFTVSQYSSSASASGAAALQASAFSEIEAAILRSNIPINLAESEVITVNGESGVWANKAEVVNWRGDININEYLINQDANPEVIRKRTEQLLTYEQEIAIRYLRPPTPPPPGEILIKQEKNIVTAPAPPLVIRQQPPRPETPAPLVIREAPPRPPNAVGAKVITISGKRIPPPPRKVIIERLAPLPTKPQAVLIERWLPYNQTKRRVIFQRNTVADPVIVKPKNVIIQWEAPQVNIKKEFKDLGVIRANPVEYVQRYGASLKQSVELPTFVKEIRPPTGVVLASEYVASGVFELEGDVQALSLIDLDSNGLAEYRRYLQVSGSQSALSFNAGAASFQTFAQSAAVTRAAFDSVFAEIFSAVDRDRNGRISVNETESLLLKLNSRLGRSYGENEVRVFFSSLDKNGDGYIDFEEFRSALLRLFGF